MTPTQIVLLVLIPLVLWRVYARIRRMVGRQQSRPWRHWVAAIFFPLVLALLAAAALRDALAIASLVAGIVAGIGLATWGLRLTRFERTPEGVFYTPSAHIGIAVTLLFVARVLYRMVEVFGGMARPGAQDFARSPLTLAVFGVLAAYYAAYASGVLRWRRRNPA
jgi:ABC-type arginine transport system permease subunit